MRILKQLSGRCGVGDLDEKCLFLTELMSSLAGFSDWAAAMSLFKQLPMQQHLSCTETLTEIRRLVQRLRMNKLDLYEGVRALAKTQTQDHVPQTLPELIEHALAHLP